MTLFRILVADDHEVVRHGMRFLLESRSGWEICGEAADGREAVEKALRSKPDLAILDISMPTLNGLEATRQILKILPQAEVLILTMHESEEVMREVLEAGARGYVLKSSGGRDLVAAVEALQQRRTFFSPKVGEMVLQGYLTRAAWSCEETASHRALTPREREVVQLLAEGKTNKEVSAALGLSVKTAETHRMNIMRKLNLHSLSDLVRYAVRNNIVQP